MKLVIASISDKKARAATKVAALVSIARDELEISGQNGLTARELRRKHPGEDLIHYARALQVAAKDLKAKQSWTAIRPPIDMALQEGRYHMTTVVLEKAE